MTNVSSLTSETQQVQYLQQLQTQANTLEQQLSTGMVSTTYSGIATQAAQLVNLQSLNEQQQGYIDTGTTVGTKLQLMSQAMTSVSTVVNQFQTDLTQNAYSGSTGGVSIQQTAQQLLTEVGSYLNTQDGSSYVFSGNKSSTAAFNPATLPNPGDLTTNVAADYYQGDNGVASAQVDKNVTMNYGVTANNPAFEQVIRVLNYYANDPTPPSQTNPADVANVNAAQQLLTTASQQLQTLVANAGEQQSNITQLATQQKATQTLATTNISNIVQVNSATVITQLNTLQTQLQASYQTISMLQGMSLANYLK
jgi:flagellar hook-associated protein 3 FlgL